MSQILLKTAKIEFVLHSIEKVVMSSMTVVIKFRNCSFFRFLLRSQSLCLALLPPIKYKKCRVGRWLWRQRRARRKNQTKIDGIV